MARHVFFAGDVIRNMLVSELYQRNVFISKHDKKDDFLVLCFFGYIISRINARREILVVCEHRI